MPHLAANRVGSIVDPIGSMAIECPAAGGVERRGFDKMQQYPKALELFRCRKVRIPCTNRIHELAARLSLRGGPYPR